MCISDKLVYTGLLPRAIFPPRAKAYQTIYTASLRSKLGSERSDRLHKARENHIITI